MNPTRDSENHQLDDYLEILYHLHERRVFDELVAQKLATLDGDAIAFTGAGFKRAESIVRRHRLAERLLHDVLHMGPEDIERGACEFEHLPAEEITESICILLGHPRTCPHGAPIPKGPCCDAAATEVESAVVPLTSLPVGTWARVAYVASQSDELQHRLAHYDLCPGNRVKVHQLRPSIIVASEGAMLAMEEKIAREIFVWKGWHGDRDEERVRGRRRAGAGGGFGALFRRRRSS
jgi:DtxR family Mn-dependent transcriptional regulator